MDESYCDDDKKEYSNKTGTAPNYETRSRECSGHLKHSHEKADTENNLPTVDKPCKRNDITGKINNFRVCGSTSEIKSSEKHERQGPQRSRPRSEESVIKTNGQTK